jgi:LuxR family maltose regulon positive regulatory protein
VTTSAGAPLLATKLYPPRLRNGTIHRPRLTRRSEQELPSLILVSAPAGFGKTTFLADFVAQHSESRRTAWLSLDHTDNEPAVFWDYLIAAVQSVAPDAGAAASDQVGAGQPLPSAASLLLNDLAGLDGELLIVLDDYHVIEAPEIHEAISRLVEHAPAQLHVVLAGRTDPPLPLARLRARGELLEIRAADLRFTTEETAIYFDESAGLALAPADIAALESRTEGWIAALQLAALSMQGRDDPQAFIAEFAGDDRFVVDYLAEEVLDRQPDDVRGFLLHTSILNRFTSGLCDAVTGKTDGKSMLDQLDRANLFLVPLDDRRHWYRYHHLFADVLRAHLLDEEPSLVPVLHRRASEWYEAHGDVAEAIAHAMSAGDAGRAAQLIELTAPLLRRKRQEGTLRRWLEALPDDVFTDRPVLAINLVGARMATGDTAGVERLLALVDRSLEPSRPAPVVFDHAEMASLPAQISVYRAALALLAGDLDATLAHARDALAVVAPDDHLRRGSASALIALAHWSDGDLHTAQQRYDDAISALLAAEHLADALGCSLALADIQIVQGRLSDATRTFEAGLRLTAEHPGLRGAADMHIGLSEVLIERNDLDGAAQHLDTSAELGESAGLPQHAYRRRITMARLCRARGDLAMALALIDEALPLFDTDFSPPVRPVEATRARVLLANGDFDGARTWVITRGLTVNDELSYIREYEHLTLARVLVATGSRESAALDDASRLLDRLLDAADAGGRVGSAIEIRILQAAAEHARGDATSALAALEDAIRRAEPEGHIRLFLHAGAGVTALLRSLAQRSDSSAHLHRIVAASAPPAADRAVESLRRTPLVDELSARELEVLRLLGTDLSGPDIARELVVSLNTVRTHTKNIYSKLGVSGRREAVTRARELGL